MLADPVVAALRRPTALKRPMSADAAVVTLPTRPPDVTIARRLPAPAPSALHTAHESEAQSVCSHTVWLRRIEALWLARFRLKPCTVITIDPVAAIFVPATMLTANTSTEWLTVTVPATCPLVKDTRRLPQPPCPAWHRTDESDSQLVTSHAVQPTLNPAVNDPCPMLEPRTVTLADPVAARLSCRTPLNTAPVHE